MTKFEVIGGINCCVDSTGYLVLMCFHELTHTDDTRRIMPILIRDIRVNLRPIFRRDIMPATILIADGEDGYLSLMKAALIKEGFRVITSSSGHDALNLAQQEGPDLIILKLGLPDMDGFEFMRHNGYDEQIPIIMPSADAGIDDRVRGLELGADDFITKPFGLLELTSRVRAVLRRAGRADPQTEALPGIETVHRLDYNSVAA